MDKYEKISYSLLGFVAVIYVLLLIFGLVAAFPFGIIGFIAIAGVGLLIIKVIKERLNNKEDDYYSKNVDQ
ncbi:hypothetical protein [Sessilibacter sp. MAH2]